MLDKAYYKMLEDELQRLNDNVQHHDFKIPTKDTDDKTALVDKWAAKLQHDTYLLEKHAR